MENSSKYRDEIDELGFSIIDNIYSGDEIKQILDAISRANTSKETFRKSNDLFAIRQFIKEVPETINLIFTDKLKGIIALLLGDDYFIVKSIYFDKPEKSNWYVAYHQDLTISVNEKIATDDYKLWTKKQNQFAVEPPIEVLENIFTIRIHLDETNADNGALKVIEKSHLKKIYRAENIEWERERNHL